LIGGHFAHDTGRDRFVYFGGSDPYSFTPVDETWELDPTSDTWELKNPAHRPEARAQGQFFYEPSLGQMVLLGGDTGQSGPAPHSTVWAWDGVDWQLLDSGDPLLARARAGNYYDPDRHQLVLLGGFMSSLTAPREQGLATISVVGQLCHADTDCPTAHCIDGVCCATPCEGTCSACDVPGHQGECILVPRGLPDPDSCALGACDGQGQCRAFLGQPCAEAADCADGFCTDGVCCLAASCEGECRRCGREADGPAGRGVCVAVKATAHEGEVTLGVEDLDTCHDDHACDPAGRCTKKTGQPCASPDECVGAVCADGVCRDESPPFCDGDHTLYFAGGQQQSCLAYRCTTDGKCQTSCTTGADCAADARCDLSGRCVAGRPASEDGVGCTVGPRPGRGAAGLWLVLLGLGLAARRRGPRALGLLTLGLLVGCGDPPPLTLSPGASGAAGGGGAAGAGQGGTGGTGAGAAGRGGQAGETGAAGSAVARLDPAASLAACEAYGSRFCALFAQCLAPSFARSFRDLDDCVSFFQTTCQRAAMAPGALTLSAEDGACIEATATGSCDDLVQKTFNQPGVLACRSLPVGAAPDGQPCAVGSQCASGRCRLASWQGCGRCQAVAEEGDECAFSRDFLHDSGCARGLYCSFDGSCHRPRNAGEKCDFEQICAVGFYCDGICLPSPKPGEPCLGLPGECGLLDCSGNPATCQPLSVETEVGKPCGYQAKQFVYTVCGAGLSCLLTGQPSGTCQPAPGEGAPCSSDLNAPCAGARLTCIEGVCQVPFAVDPAMCL
jgi:hypothetical protein